MIGSISCGRIGPGSSRLRQGHPALFRPTLVSAGRAGCSIKHRKSLPPQNGTLPIARTGETRTAASQDRDASLPAGKNWVPTEKSIERTRFETEVLFAADYLSSVGGDPLSVLGMAVRDHVRKPKKAPRGRPRVPSPPARQVINEQLSKVASLLGNAKPMPPFARLPRHARRAVCLAYVGVLELAVRDGRPSPSHPSVRAQLRWLALERERETRRTRGEPMPTRGESIEVPSEKGSIRAGTIETDILRNAPWLCDK